MSRSTRPGRSERRPSRANASARLSREEVGLGRLDAVPEDFRRLPAASAREERAAPQDGVRFPQRDHHPDEPEEAGVSLRERPVDPAQRVILAPGVVVAVLGAQELVARQDHGHALRDHQGRHQVAHLAASRSGGRPARRSAPRRRSSSSSWRRCRRGSPRRWPRCVCGCRRPGRSSVKPSWQQMKLMEWSGPRPA